MRKTACGERECGQGTLGDAGAEEDIDATGPEVVESTAPAVGRSS